MIPEPIRVLQVFAQMNRGGAETMIMNLYRNIDRSKIQFDFIVHTEEKGAFDEEIKRLGGRIYRVPRYNGKNHFTYKKKWESFFKNHPEYKIIHGHIRSTAVIYLNIARKQKIKTIIHSHSTASRGSMFQKIIKGIMQLPIRYIADYMFACSYEAGIWLFGENSTKKPNFKIMKNAIDVNKYSYDEYTRLAIKKEFSIEDYLVVGHIGNFTHPKNHKFLIDIFYELKKTKNKSVLLLVGDGELQSEIKQKVNKLGLDDSVIFTGARSDVPNLLQGIDVMIFPSIYEGLPVTLIEAQATGLRCIISDSITEEVNITSLIEYMSINKSATKWSEKILVDTKHIVRKSHKSEINNSGYDVNKVSKEYSNFYTDLSKIIK